ncbi:MAG: flagellar hook-length control protein FliK [Nitrospirae bacterium]|nr:flagellar hook-length control protein FliK [Nitrospirota bacterium]
MLEGNRALISVQGLGITAESTAPLKPGDTVKLQITQLRPQVVLSLLSSTPAPADPVSTRIRDLLPSRERLGALVGEILADLPPMGSEETPELTELSRALKDWVVSEDKLPGLSIPKQIHALGLQRENLLRMAARLGTPQIPLGDDLRTRLARILKALPDIVPPVSGKLLSSLRRLSDNLELIKWLNSVPRENDGAQLLPLLLQFSTGEWSDVDIYFLKKTGDKPDQDEGKREKTPPYRVVMLLNLPSMGNVQIDASFTGKTLYLTFYAAEPTTRAKAQERAPELQSALESLGWSARLSFNDLRREAAGSGPVQILIPKGYRLIDTRA